MMSKKLQIVLTRDTTNNVGTHFWMGFVNILVMLSNTFMCLLRLPNYKGAILYMKVETKNLL